MKKLSYLLMAAALLIVGISSCDDYAPDVSELEGSWKWTNTETDGTHLSYELTVSGENIVWTSVFNPESTVGQMWASWGIEGTINIINPDDEYTHFDLNVSRLYVMTDTGVETDIPAIPMEDYSAVKVNSTIKGTYHLNGDDLDLNLDFIAGTGDYPEDSNLIYDFVRQ